MLALSTRKKILQMSCGLFVALLSTFVYAVDWAWQLEHSDLYDSLISINRADGSHTTHEFSCDLGDALGKVSDEPAATVDRVITHSKPNGIFIVSCFVGAHSEQLVIIDPLSEKQAPAFKIVGSYFVDWSIDAGQVLIRYDVPCESDNVCETPFITVEQQWP